MVRRIEVSHKTIIFSVFFIIFLGFLFIIREIILQLFVALLLMTILDPLVNKISSIKVPRAIAVLVSYILFIGVLGGVVAAIAPVVIDQTSRFISALPGYLVNIGVTKELSNKALEGFLTTVGDIPGEVFKLTYSIFSNFLNVVTVLVFAFYMLLSRSKLDEQLGNSFGEAKSKEVGRVINNLEYRLGGWARGELTLMLAVGLGTYVGYMLLGIPFALPLAILAGLFEIIPVLGPIVSAVPAIIIGFGISPFLGFGAIAVAFLVQQLENYILVPKIMEKSVGVSPIITLVAITIGARLAGIVGVIISVPMVITIQVLIKEYLVKE
jgi:predicted PurR-regulated permease PerM